MQTKIDDLILKLEESEPIEKSDLHKVLDNIISNLRPRYISLRIRVGKLTKQNKELKEDIEKNKARVKFLEFYIRNLGDDVLRTFTGVSNN